MERKADDSLLSLSAKGVRSCQELKAAILDTNKVMSMLQVLSCAIPADSVVLYCISHQQRQACPWFC